MDIGANSADRDVMLRHARERNPQLACLKHYESSHPGAVTTKGVELDGVGNHPNAWFSASVSYRKIKAGTGGGDERRRRRRKGRSCDDGGRVEDGDDCGFKGYFKHGRRRLN